MRQLLAAPAQARPHHGEPQVLAMGSNPGFADMVGMLLPGAILQNMGRLVAMTSPLFYGL